MKVLLINPPGKYDSPLLTLSLGYLSAALKSNNHNGRILDLWAEPFSDNVLRTKISEYNPDLIGITFFTIRYNETKILANKIKSWFPDIKIVAGGNHPSALPREVLEEIDSIDLVVIGEGEKTIVELVEALKSGNFGQVKGIAFRDKEKIVITPPREYIKDLDTLPFPDLEQFNPDKYESRPPFGWYGRTLTMVTTRGCPGRCVFCSKSVFQHTVRAISPERIVQEIKHWKDKWAFEEIKFYDDNFTMLKKRTFEICDRLIKEKINMPWTCTTRVDCLTKDMLIKMKEAGLYLITFGVESGSSKVLKSLKKGYRIEHIINACKWCRQLNIKTAAFFLIGNPDETVEDMKTTFRLQKAIRPNFVIWGILQIFPGSELFDVYRGVYNYTTNKELPYIEILRKDIDENYMRKFCRNAMFRHYTSFNGMKSILAYLQKTGHFKKAVGHYIKYLQSKM